MFCSCTRFGEPLSRPQAFHVAKPHFTHKVHFTNPARDLFQAALGVQIAGVLLKFFGMPEGIRQLGNHMELFFRQLVGVGRIYRGEVAVQHGINLVTEA